MTRMHSGQTPFVGSHGLRGARYERCRPRVSDVIVTKDSEARDRYRGSSLGSEFHPNQVFAIGYHLAILRPSTWMTLGSYLARALQSKAVAYQCFT